MDTGKITVAAFDFDGTLTRRDSLLPFLLYSEGPVNFAIKMTKASPALLAYAARLMRNDTAKENLLRTFLHRRPLADIEAIGTSFARERVPAMLLDDAYARFLWHKAQGHVCVLVSASLIHYLEPWAKSVGFDHVIGSQLASDGNGQVSGRLDGGNCYGEQKASRLRAWLGPGRQSFMPTAIAGVTGKCWRWRTIRITAPCRKVNEIEKAAGPDS